MSRYWPISAAYLIVFLTLMINWANMANDGVEISAQRSLLEKLNKLLSDINQLSPRSALRVVSLKVVSEIIWSPEVSTAKPKKCQDGWIEYEGSCFLFSKCFSQCSTDAAERQCQFKHDAHLAKIASVAHQKFFRNSFQTAQFILIGGNDRAEEGTWRWPDGSLVDDSIAPWHKGKRPNRDKNCIYLDPSHGTWTDVDCSLTFTAGSDGYVCEKPLV